MKPKAYISAFIIFLILLPGAASWIDAQVAVQNAPSSAFAAAIANLKFREIGPAIMGGRVDEFAVVETGA